MRIDERCRRLNEMTGLYQHHFRQLTERYFIQECARMEIAEPLCLGDYSFLFLLYEQAGKNVSMAEISRRMNINPSTATRQAARLMTSGLISKSASSRNKHRFEIRLTEKGALLVDRMDQQLFDAVKTVYDGISTEEMQTVYGFLEKCNQRIRQLADSETAEE